MAELVFEHLTKRFGQTTAVADLSLKIADGEFIVLLGPTGAGKTTTLRLAAGIEHPDEGAIFIAGQDVTRAAPHARDVAFVFQQYSLYPHLSVYDNLAFPLRSPLLKWPEDRIRTKVSEVAELLRIGQKLKNKATQLSGGEMQRVAIGRALVRSPNVYLMDEPLSSLDAKLREDLRVELKRIQLDLGTTLLYVTHDQVEALTMADRIGVLDQGRLVQVGTPEEIYKRPDNVYVAQRLGSPPINLLPVDTQVTAAPSEAATIGVRPEDIVLGEEGIPVNILEVEHLGAETVLLLDMAGSQVHALADPGKRAVRGEHTRMAVIPGTALYFDQQGLRLEGNA